MDPMHSISSLNTDTFIKNFTNTVESTDIRVKIFLEYSNRRAKMVTLQRIQQDLEISKIICEAVMDVSNGNMIRAEYTDFCNDFDWWFSLASESLEQKKDQSYMLLAHRFADVLRSKLFHIVTAVFHRMDPVYAPRFTNDVAQNIDPSHMLSQSVINYMFNYLS